MTQLEDEYLMRLALAEASKAKNMGEVPIGAIVEKDGDIISRAHNLSEASSDPTAHAEILAIREAAKKLGNWRLRGANVYVTIEPCAMCIGAIVLARIQRLVFGARDLKAGAVLSIYNIGLDKRLNHFVKVKEGILMDECANLLRDFFKKIRAEKP
jgi:tRNA(adenine34) deaminase